MECTNPGGCTLNSAEIVERVNEWRSVSSRAISREVHGERITSIYPPDPDVTRPLKDLIAAETICCSFLKFDVHEYAHETVVELTFPEEARALIERVMALPSQVSPAG